VRPNQWFGSGASARNMTIANQELRQAMVSANIKGVHFNACTLG